MLTQNEILTLVKNVDLTYLRIDDLEQYAQKVATLGKSVEVRENGEVVSFVLYYESNEEIYITLVWTKPSHLRLGLGKKLVRQLINSTGKNVRLQMHKDNPASTFYGHMNFEKVDEKDGVITYLYRRKIAVMQPYIFPYIGYFHLIESSDLIVFYDDVRYITRGWINRNRILSGEQDYRFTVPVVNASQNRLINETYARIDSFWKNKLLRTAAHSYGKAPYYAEMSALLDDALPIGETSIADLAINSIRSVYGYLQLPLNYVKSSETVADIQGLNKADRLINITKRMNFDYYINTVGCASLYDKEYFKRQGVELGFVRSKPISYPQFKNLFVPRLSILDIIAFNSPREVKKMFRESELI